MNVEHLYIYQVVGFANPTTYTALYQIIDKHCKSEVRTSARVQFCKNYFEQNDFHLNLNENENFFFFQKQKKLMNDFHLNLNNNEFFFQKQKNLMNDFHLILNGFEYETFVIIFFSLPGFEFAFPLKFEQRRQMKKCLDFQGDTRLGAQ